MVFVGINSSSTVVFTIGNPYKGSRDYEGGDSIYFLEKSSLNHLSLHAVGRETHKTIIPSAHSNCLVCTNLV